MLLKLLFAFLVAVNGKTVFQHNGHSHVDGHGNVYIGGGFMEVESNPCVEKCVQDDFGYNNNLLNEGMHHIICQIKCDSPDEFKD